MGPICSILLNRKIDFEEIQQVDEFLKSIVKGDIKSTKSARDFWVDSTKFPKLNAQGSNCQFSFHFDNKLNFMDEDEMLEIEIVLGFTVQSQVSISAGCNQVGDHNVLGELALEIAKILNGLIDFHGDLNIYKKGITEELEGQVYAIEYNEGMAECHIIDSEFMSHWLKHPNFRMIK